MADEVSADTFEHSVGGKVLVFRKVERGQVQMLQRYVDTLRTKAKQMLDVEDLDGIIEVGKKITLATWTTIESQFTSPDDLEWVQLEIIAGRVKENDLLPLLHNGEKFADPVDDDADPAPAVKRPGRKAPAKKAAKKASAPRAAR